MIGMFFAKLTKLKTRSKFGVLQYALYIIYILEQLIPTESTRSQSSP